MLLLLVLRKFLRVAFYFLQLCPDKLTLFWKVARSKVHAMIVYDVATKELGTESIHQHNITDLISGITFIALFSQDKPLR